MNAYAEDCDKFTSNPEWKSNFPIFKNQIDSEQYSDALETAKVLYKICPRSPALNYLTGVALEKTGETNKARTMYEKASEYTSEFATEPEMARRIWFARYEAENPYKTDDAIDALKEKIVKLEEENKSQNQMVWMDQESNKAMMWSGTAIGGTGVILVIVGAALAFGDYKVYNDVTGEDFSSQREYESVPRYSIGLGLLGAGIGLTVAGAITAGIGGYNYVQLNKQKTQDVAVHLGFSYNYAELKLEF